MAKETGSILTPSQRDYLNGDPDVDPDSSHGRMIESRIRNRLHAAIEDLDLILSSLSPDDISQAFSATEDDLEPGAVPPIANSMKALPALVYLYHRHEESRAEKRDDGWLTALEVERGIKDALGRMEVAFDSVDVDIHVERRGPLDELDDEPLASLTRDQLDQLHTAGKINDKEYGEALIRKSAAEKANGEDE